MQQCIIIWFIYYSRLLSEAIPMPLNERCVTIHAMNVMANKKKILIYFKWCCIQGSPDAPPLSAHTRTFFLLYFFYSLLFHGTFADCPPNNISTHIVSIFTQYSTCIQARIYERWICFTFIFSTLEIPTQWAHVVFRFFFFFRSSCRNPAYNNVLLKSIDMS